VDVGSSVSNLEQPDNEIATIFNNDFRLEFPDCYGRSLKLGWFFKTNCDPVKVLEEKKFNRHKVRDFFIDNYSDLMREFRDEHCFSYSNEERLDDDISDDISRQIIERNWFPVAFRAENETYGKDFSDRIDKIFPIDYSISLDLNHADDSSHLNSDWSVRKSDLLNLPDSVNSQRLFARTLNFTKNGINKAIEDAFSVAENGRSAILSIVFKDVSKLSTDINDFLKRVNKVSRNFNDLKWEYATPTEAIVNSIGYEQSPKSLFVEALIHNGKMRIWTTSEIFQNIPWIVVEDSANNIFRIEKNVFQDSSTSWEVDLSKYENIRTVGIGVSSQNGLSDVAIINPEGQIQSSFLNKSLRQYPANYRDVCEHSKLYPRLCIERVLELAPEMDCIKQLCSILNDHSPSDKTLLDVGCASGQLFLSSKKLGLDYHGIDTFQRGIQIGKLILPQKGLAKSKLRNISINQIPPGEDYDFVVNLFTFRYSEQFENHLEVMARATKQTLIIRAPSFGEKNIKRFLPDILLEEKFQTLKSFFNIYDEKEVEQFLIKEGFVVSWVEDIRQKQKFSSQPEIVGGIEFQYKFLVAERIKNKPSKEEILGDYWGKHARHWIKDGEGLPK